MARIRHPMLQLWRGKVRGGAAIFVLVVANAAQAIQEI
jgi:hypothetical protein